MTRYLKAGDLATTEGDEIRRVHLRAWQQHDAGTGDLLQAAVGHADDWRLADGRVLEQQRFHFHRVHVFATHFEHVFVPPEETDRPVGTHDRHIAAVQPPVPIHGLRGLLRLLIVTLHDPVAATA